MYQKTRFDPYEFYSDLDNQIIRASIEGMICAICGKEFSKGETIVRDLLTNIGPTSRSGHNSNTVAPCCLSHRNFWIDNRPWLKPHPCQNCQRPVINLYRELTRTHTFCCARCERKWWNRKNRKSTRIECEQCGEEFNQKRSDQKYCKPACRQTAFYRRSRNTLKAS